MTLRSLLTICAAASAVGACRVDRSGPASAPPESTATAPASPPLDSARAAAHAAWTRNRALWAAAGPERYAVDETVSCECAPPYRFTVLASRAGVDSLIVDPADAAMWRKVPGYSAADAAAAFDRGMSVDSAFALIGEGLRRADRVWVEYDLALGYPRSVGIDWSLEMADEETSRTFENLRARR